MKKSTFMFIISMGSFLIINAQVTDTLAYLKNIEANKSQYIGHAFSYLKSNMSINLSSFSSLASIPSNKNAETSTFFWIKPPVNDNDYATFPKLEVFWEIKGDKSVADSLWRKNVRGYWTSRVDSLYGSKIIKDIMVY